MIPSLHFRSLILTDDGNKVVGEWNSNGMQTIVNGNTSPVISSSTNYANDRRFGLQPEAKVHEWMNNDVLSSFGGTLAAEKVKFIADRSPIMAAYITQGQLPLDKITVTEHSRRNLIKFEIAAPEAS